MEQYSRRFIEEFYEKGKKRKYKERYYNFNELNEYQIRFVMPWEEI